MTRLERFRQYTKDDIAEILCFIQCNCGTCPASEYCGYEHKGFIDWLEQDVGDDYKII